LNARRVLKFPVVPHHVVEVDVLIDDGTVAHVVVDKLALRDALTAAVAVHRVTVRSAVSKVVDERPQHLASCPVAVFELGMLHMVIRRLTIIHMTLLYPHVPKMYYMYYKRCFGMRCLFNFM